jgi:hypothetical protein
MLQSSRVLVSLFVAALIIPANSYSFNSPLSEEAVREAYFLGQRRDESTARFLAQYKQRLDAPETGPYIASVELLTPFALEVFLSSQYSVGYSAQRAEAEHVGKEELVAINVEVLLTDSYGALIARPTGERSGSPVGYAFRSSDFWRDFSVQVTVDAKIVRPSHFRGDPTYLCNEGGCQLTGAMLHLEFAAGAFDSDLATIKVVPPEGPEVWVDFDLTALR